MVVAQTIERLADQVMQGTPMDRCQAEWLVEHAVGPRLPDLFSGAGRIREQFFGSRIRCCSIVASKVGRCSEDCAFCSQSAHYKTHVGESVVLDSNQIQHAARQAAAHGAGSFGLVNSGLGPGDGELEYWGQIAGAVGASVSIQACASLGVLDNERQAHRLKALGVQRYNHNLQTSRRHFPAIIRTHSYDDRLHTLRHLKAAGISVCSGALFGMGEDWADRLDLAYELREIGPDVVPLNFLIAIDGTPLQGTEPLPPLECLKIISLFRFLLPDKEIKIAGGRESSLRDLQSWMFHAGANSFMLGNYLTTCGRGPEQDLQMLADLGLELETSSNLAVSTVPRAAVKQPAYVPLPVLHAPR